MCEKQCSVCRKDKDVESFPFKYKAKGIRHYTCRECWVVIRKASYEANKQSTFDRNKKNSQKTRAWYLEYKLKLNCERCPEKHPACLDFHHTNPLEKDNDVASMIHGNHSIAALKREIAKCVVLCANCHRKLHHEEKHGQ